MALTDTPARQDPRGRAELLAVMEAVAQTERLVLQGLRDRRESPDLRARLVRSGQRERRVLRDLRDRKATRASLRKHARKASPVRW